MLTQQTKMLRKGANTEEDFWEKVAVGESNDCWIWQGHRLSTGYSHFRINGARKLVHRAAYEFAFGQIPEGLVVDHKCRVRSCVNPQHLRAVTQKQNQENLSLDKRSRTGVRGVRRKDGAFEVWVGHNGKQRYYGRFSTLIEAENVAVQTRNSLYTHNDSDRIDPK